MLFLGILWRASAAARRGAKQIKRLASFHYSRNIWFLCNQCFLSSYDWSTFTKVLATK